MIRRVVVSCFKKFRRLEFELQERALIAGPNNSGKTTLLQVLATWAELGEIWLESNADLAREADGTFHRVEVEIASFRTLALSRFDELWHNQETRTPISIRVSTDHWDVGFDLHYQDAGVATVGPLAEISENQLEAYAEKPLKALYIPSLSGLDVHEPEYGEKVLATRLAHGKGGMVVRNMVQAVSRDGAKWRTLQNTVQTFFGLELSMPSGADPIMVRYRHSAEERWYDLVNGAAGFLQTVLVQSALLYSDATLFLIDEPDAHLHALLKEKMYRLIRTRCNETDCQAVIATHSGRLIEEAANEKGEKLFLVTARGLNPVRQREAKELLKIPTEQIVHAETLQRVLYLEGKSDLDILREWARALEHPALKRLEGVLWVATAEEEGRSFPQRHFRALRAQIPTLRALEVVDRNGDEGEGWKGLTPGELRIDEGNRKTPDGMKRAFWSRYEIENYLLHPRSIIRFVSQSVGEVEAESVKEYMEKYLPPVLFERPFESTSADRTKGKVVIAEVLTSGGVELGEAEYFEVASVMTPDEIHPDVNAMLDVVEDQLAYREIDL